MHLPASTMLSVRLAMVPRSDAPSRICRRQCCCRSMTNWVFEAKEGAVEELIPTASAVMAAAPMPAGALSVSLVIEGGAGKNWAAAH